VKDVIKGNFATAVAAKLARVNVVPAYPITPSTLFPEQISEFIANGEMDAELVLVESEHSAMSAAIGASAVGARVATATASQGLELMHEMLFIASGMRLPIVMAVGNRALSAPINIWCDHQDTISARDSGWMQFYAENNQEALDLMLMAFKIAEDRRVLLPAMVGLDAFVLTHTIEPVDIPEQEKVDEFLPPYKPLYTLDPQRPMTFGSFGTPAHYMEFKKSQTDAMERARGVIDEVFSQFKEMFGREYNQVTPFMTDDADIIIVSMGSMSGTVREAVREMRKEGKKVGLLKITTLRPFPGKKIVELTGHARAIAVMDRNISPGFGGAVFGEISAAFINRERRPKIYDYIVGLGGRDIVLEDIRHIVESTEKKISDPSAEPVEWVNVHPEEVIE